MRSGCDHGMRLRVMAASVLLSALVVLSGGSAALAGGGAQNVALIVDPEDPVSTYLANYYRNARGVPERNIFYFKPGATNYGQFVTDKLPSLFGMLANREVGNQIDFILLMPSSQFYVADTASPRLVADGCSPVNRFSIASCYTMAYIASNIQARALNSQDTNRYASFTDTVAAFHSTTGWLSGAPDNSASSRRYFCAGLLGYTGANGNTVAELTQMIDRSVAADFTRPAGTFYFVPTTDQFRSPPRDGLFSAAVTSITSPPAPAVAGSAVILPTGSDSDSVLPIGRQDCLGIMTGWASPNILLPTYTILPGAFADHLTSYAGTFDTAAQAKMSLWIQKGASGTCGTVEEPCNYPGKFPSPSMHAFYYKQLNLGEACFRSLAYTPFQPLIYGDILTQPFAYRPTFSGVTYPAEPLSGVISITPTASTSRPATSIAKYELYVNGRFQSSIAAGQSFCLNTTALPDGVNEFRVVAIDSSEVETQWRQIDVKSVANSGRSAVLTASPPSGGRNTLFNIGVSAAGAAVTEIRLMANDRVFAAAQGASGNFAIYGDMFGAGPVRLYAVAEFSDGRLARSAFSTINIDFNSPAPAGGQTQPPVAYGFLKDVPANQPFILELPASDADTSALTYAITQNPTQATLSASGRTALVRPNAGATGTDTIRFTANDGAATSAAATITLRYGCPAIAICQQPVGGTVCSGSTLTLSVSVQGPGPFTYQWRQNNQDVTGATSSTLPLTVNSSTIGTYTVVISNACRAQVSDPAVVAMNTTPPITMHPGNASVCTGQTAMFSVATSDPNPTYQWQKGNPTPFVNIDPLLNPSAATPTLVLGAVSTSDSAYYRCRVRNGCGNSFSNAGFLNVSGPPRGDMNGDCSVTAADIPTFVNVLLGNNTDPTLVQRADMNFDGFTDGADAQGFVNALPN